MSQTIFKKVALSEKKNIFKEIAQDKVHISVKVSDPEMAFHLIAVQVEKDENLLCHLTADSKGLNQNYKVVVNFILGAERYFFHTETKVQSGWVVLSLENDLFQLQRRNNVRFEMPEEYPCSFIMTQHEGKKYFVECKLKDISAGGIKIEVPLDHPPFRIGEVLKGSLRLGNRRPMEFEVEVRFIHQQFLGLQFLKVDHLLENRLLSLMMDLQREIFLKFPKRQT